MSRRFFLFLNILFIPLWVSADSWIRINQLGYLPRSSKVAVLMSQEEMNVSEFRLVDVFTGQVAACFTGRQVKSCGPLGQMKSTYRLYFSKFEHSGTYYIEANGVKSPVFPINGDVYNGLADFVLHYMRQQRCSFNPFFRDSCHQHDAFIANHPTRSGEHIDVRGGWHDASDYLQYTATSANAIYQMMLAYRQCPEIFPDNYKANGLPGSNGIPDIVDEIYWGLDWLNRMNPRPDEIYNQIGDDRDHVGMRRPAHDRADYGWGPDQGRPVYFCNGQPQQRGKFLNASTGVANTAGKFVSDFALGAQVLQPFYPDLAAQLRDKAMNVFRLGVQHPGYSQTVSVKSPYIYEESNWVDDMELAAAELFRLTKESDFLRQAAAYGRQEKITPWMGADTARHYQWYPFFNVGHAQVATFGGGKVRREFLGYLRSGIEAVLRRAKGHPFLNGIPSIWCSNNLTVAMLSQCILYRQLSGNDSFMEMEGALRDWLLGCNPWGVSMIVELPLTGMYPHQPHSSVVSLKLGNTTGGLVDGPVYSTIFGSLWGVHLEDPTGRARNYMEFQPGTMVYHDNIHDYSTNEPTMDGTASLTFPFAFYQQEGAQQAKALPDRNLYREGGIYRGDPLKKNICLVFTAAEMADGADFIIPTLRRYAIHGGFFFTGAFYERFPDIVRRLLADGHYVGSHSYGHLLYSPWDNRDSMLVTEQQFRDDMLHSYNLMAQFGIKKEDAPYFIPPYEHYNATVSSWAKTMGLQVINYTPGTASNADYTTSDMKNYRSSQVLFDNLLRYEATQPNGLNGHFLLIHFGTSDARTDKFYKRLPEIIETFQQRGYRFVSVPELLGKRK